MHKLISAILSLCLMFILSLSAVSYAEYDTLSYGSWGVDVSTLQKRLNELEFSVGGVDGQYGSLTRGAIKSFQSRNGLEATGIADNETLTLLYSDEALSKPDAPEIEVTGLSKGNFAVYMALKNNSSAPIDSCDLFFIAYDSIGNVISNDATKISRTTYTFTPINPGQTSTIDLGYLSDVNNSKANNPFGVYIVQYHSTDGYIHEFSYDQIYIFLSDGGRIYPKSLTEAAVMSDSEYNANNKVLIGYNYYVYYPWVAQITMYPAGEKCEEVYEESIAEKAGLISGSVVTEIDGESILNSFATARAKAKMLNGESVSLTYWKNNKEYTVMISQDMDPVSVDEEDNETDIASQIEKLNELYEKGILTEEEFKAAKAKIIG